MQEKHFSVVVGVVLISIALILLFGLSMFERTAFLLQITSSDPLFYSPAVDIDSLETQIAELGKADLSVRSVLQKRIAERSLKTTAEEERILTQITDLEFLPLSYLEALPAAISATERFLSSPTLLNALWMTFTDYRTALRYLTAAENWRDFIVSSHELASSHDYSIRFLATETDARVLEYDAELIYQNGRQLVSESRKRMFCLLFRSCDGVEISRDSAQKTDIREAPVENYDLLPDTFTNLNYEHLTRSGPYLLKQSCFSDADVPFYLFKSESEFIPKQASESYYWDFSDEDPNSQNPYVKKAFERGVLYDNQPEGTNYRCPDLEYWTELALLDYFHREYFEMTSSADLADLTDRLQGNTDELSQTHLLILENRMVDFPSMIGTIGNYLRVYASLLESYWDTTHPLYLLGVRSSYSLLFNTYSHSVWRIYEKPLYVSKRNLPLSSAYTTYSVLLSEYSPEEILKFHEKVSF